MRRPRTGSAACPSPPRGTGARSRTRSRASGATPPDERPEQAPVGERRAVPAADERRLQLRQPPQGRAGLLEVEGQPVLRLGEPLPSGGRIAVEQDVAEHQHPVALAPAGQVAGRMPRRLHDGAAARSKSMKVSRLSPGATPTKSSIMPPLARAPRPAGRASPCVRLDQPAAGVASSSSARMRRRRYRKIRASCRRTSGNAASPSTGTGSR
jgi:hypothetical protein